jgi:glucose dehydrogenase
MALLHGSRQSCAVEPSTAQPGRSDNQFLSSIVALDAKTGFYKWHYQVDPGLFLGL